MNDNNKSEPATKADLKGLATKADLQELAHTAKADLQKLAQTTKADMQKLATKADLQNLAQATKADLQNLAQATKADMQKLATKADLQKLAQTTKADMQKLTQTTKADLQELAHTAKADLIDLKTELNKKIDSFTQKLAIEITKTQADVREIKYDMATKMSTKDDINRILSAIDKFAAQAENYKRKDLERGHMLMVQDDKLQNHETRLQKLEAK